MAILSLAWWGAKLIGLKTAVSEGTARWWNADTARALAVVITSLALLAGAVLLFKAGQSGGGARATANLVSQWSAVKERIWQAREARQKVALDEAASARDQALQDLEQQADRVAALERELAALKQTQAGDPVVFPRALVRTMK